jgi:hypothetical protein
MKKIFSFDAETDGLWGQAFAIGAVVTDEHGKELDRFLAKLPDSVITDAWVKDNIHINIKSTHTTYADMLKDFSVFYMKHKQDSTCVVRMGYIVEAKLLRDMVEYGFIGQWDAPYPLIDISAMLLQKGEDSTSVDSYVAKHNISINDYGGTHNPLYDSEVALKTFLKLL